MNVNFGTLAKQFIFFDKACFIWLLFGFAVFACRRFAIFLSFIELVNLVVQNKSKIQERHHCSRSRFIYVYFELFQLSVCFSFSFWRFCVLKCLRRQGVVVNFFHNHLQREHLIEVFCLVLDRKDFLNYAFRNHKKLIFK